MMCGDLVKGRHVGREEWPYVYGDLLMSQFCGKRTGSEREVEDGEKAKITEQGLWGESDILS